MTALMIIPPCKFQWVSATHSAGTPPPRLKRKQAYAFPQLEGYFKSTQMRTATDTKARPSTHPDQATAPPEAGRHPNQADGASRHAGRLHFLAKCRPSRTHAIPNAPSILCVLKCNITKKRMAWHSQDPTFQSLGQRLYQKKELFQSGINEHHARCESIQLQPSSILALAHFLGQGRNQKKEMHQQRGSVPPLLAFTLRMKNGTT
jgi:hypothetical protein